MPECIICKTWNAENEDWPNPPKKHIFHGSKRRMSPLSTPDTSG